MPQKMSQAEFIKRLKEEMPELRDFSDNDIIRGIIKRGRTDILERIETPNETRARADVINAKAQAEAEKGSHFFSNIHTTPGSYSPLGATGKSIWEYAKGATIDIPKSIIGGIRFAGQMASEPIKTSVDMLPHILDIPHQARQLYEQAGTNPGAWGRILGQTTGQGPVTEAILGGFPKGTLGLQNDIPSLIEAAPTIARAATKPIRVLGGPVEKLGNMAVSGSPAMPWGYRLKTGLIGGGLQKIGQGMKGFGVPAEELDATALSDFWGSGGKSTVGGPNSGKPITTTPEQDAWDRLADAMRPTASKATSTSINEGGRQFRDKLPADTDLGFRPATSEQPQLPFGETPSGEWTPPTKEEIPTPGRQSEGLPLEGGEGRQPIGQIAPNVNEVPVQSPSPLKDRILRDQGFEPSGDPLEDGTQMYRRKPASTEPTSTEEKISTKDLSTKQITDLYKQGWKVGPNESGIQYLIRRGKEFVGDTSGSFDWKETYKNLRQLLGRDPSAAEIEAAEARSVKPGESTGNVASFPENLLSYTPSQIKRLFEPLNSTIPEEPIDPTKLQEFLDNAPWKEQGQGKSGQIPPNEPQNDIPGIRTRNTLGPREITPSDTPVQPRMGQQDLPFGPMREKPPVDEYGIPQGRDWTPEDIFRINHEMKNAQMDFPPGARPAIPPPPLLDAEQMHIPEIGDAQIQHYLGQEDATPPEMNDLPKHSPDKISFMQKLKDMLDQEEYA